MAATAGPTRLRDPAGRACAHSSAERMRMGFSWGQYCWVLAQAQEGPGEQKIVQKAWVTRPAADGRGGSVQLSVSGSG